MSLSVIKAGFQDIVQDLGRVGYTHLGISPTGAADSMSIRMGNLLLGNDLNNAGLEITLFGGTYRFNKNTKAALCGSLFPSTIDGIKIQFFKTFEITKGQILYIGSTNDGARCYLTVENGFEVPTVLDSKSTHLMAKTGGFSGRALIKNDELNFSDSLLPGIPKKVNIKLDDNRSVLRVTKGLQYNLFKSSSIDMFFSKLFTVSHSSNRMGLRINGPKIIQKISEDIITEGLPLGAIQVPISGDPIISFVDHQTTGGYPKIANVIAADLHKVGQLKPRDKFMFKLVSLDEAEKLYFEQESLF